jgi:hypothetical protein
VDQGSILNGGESLPEAVAFSQQISNAAHPKLDQLKELHLGQQLAKIDWLQQIRIAEFPEAPEHIPDLLHSRRHEYRCAVG